MYKFLKWWNTGYVSFYLALALFLVIGLSASANDQLAAIQKEAHYYYKPDQRWCMAYSYDCRIDDPYKVLKENAVASCSHWAALKATWIAERTGYIPIIAEYDMRLNGMVIGHAVVIVPKRDGSGYWLLDNDTWRLKDVANLDWMVNAQFGTLEQFQEAYDAQE